MAPSSRNDFVIMIRCRREKGKIQKFGVLVLPPGRRPRGGSSPSAHTGTLQIPHLRRSPPVGMPGEGSGRRSRCPTAGPDVQQTGKRDELQGKIPTHPLHCYSVSQPGSIQEDFPSRARVTSRSSTRTFSSFFSFPKNRSLS